MQQTNKTINIGGCAQTHVDLAFQWRFMLNWQLLPGGQPAGDNRPIDV
jgi:hypothetical protein